MNNSLDSFNFIGNFLFLKKQEMCKCMRNEWNLLVRSVFYVFILLFKVVIAFNLLVFFSSSSFAFEYPFGCRFIERTLRNTNYCQIFNSFDISFVISFFNRRDAAHQSENVKLYISKNPLNRNGFLLFKMKEDKKKTEQKPYGNNRNSLFLF